MARAVFLDRDGVVVADADGAVPATLTPLQGVADALARLSAAGWRLVVVTNQTAIARGLLSEAQVAEQHEALGLLLGGVIDRFIVCPHHPDADLEAYRGPCSCRKPGTGMLRQAARELDVDLTASVMIGDRPTDIEAGAAAGCRTVLVKSGMHLRPRIIAPLPASPVRPDHVAPDLPAAADWVLRRA